MSIQFEPFNEFFQVPGRLNQIAVGYVYDSTAGNAVWGLVNSLIYRFNFASKVFEPVPGRLTSISVVDPLTSGASTAQTFFGLIRVRIISCKFPDNSPASRSA